MPVRGITPADAAWAAVLSLAALAIFAQAMAPRLLAQAALGPICSIHGAALHCPSCYAAAALLLAALGALSAPALAMASRRTLAAQ